MAKNNHPHDALIRYTLSIKSESKKLFKYFLPKDFVSELDLRTLKLEKDSYINEELGAYFSDIIFSCKRKGKRMLINLLIEHKSFVPKNVVLQLLRYQIEGYSLQFRQHSKNADFIPIIPIILYHGKSKWLKKSFHASFNQEVSFLFEFVPNTNYYLIDLNDYSDRAIRSSKKFLASTLLVLKHYRDKNYILEHIKDFVIFTGYRKPNEEIISYTQTFFIYLQQIQVSEHVWILTIRLQNDLFKPNFVMKTVI